MAEVARSHGVKVIVTTFEKWDPPHNEIDLITAGISWHWVDPKFGYDKAALVLRPGGTLAIFRNSYHYAPLVSDIIGSVLKLYAPHLLSNCVPLGVNISDRIDSHRNDIESRGFLHSHGFRFRLQSKHLRGSPDIVLKKYFAVIIVHGCFWHQYKACGSNRIPKTNRASRRKKFAHNRIRDVRT